ncbi:MAG: DegT/DnrJ/EryC1/StrS family aminotransferase [Desulfovermiculus sp.]|nr:DegT/DnrJ/EryC1/StrS family aminotransferase [Desulfovermiculus sp.]
MLPKRTLPPAAAPIFPRDILHGLFGALQGHAEIERFQAELRSLFQVRHCFAVCSGKAALTLILQALHSLHPDRDQVLIPAFTCYSVPSAIVRAGLQVRLADIDPETLDFDFQSLEENLQPTRDILAVVSPHLFGLPADLKRVRGLIPDPKVSNIEDAAQAMGGVDNGFFLGTQGDVGFFSLGRGKALSAVQGGVVVTDRSDIGQELESAVQTLNVQSPAQRLKILAYSLALSILMQPSMFWIPRSLPGLQLGETIFDPGFDMHRFSPFQTGLVENWPQRLCSWQQVRKRNVLHWQGLLTQFSWLQPIPSASSISNIPPLLRYPVLVQNEFLRDALLKSSHKSGLGIMPSYPDSIDGIEQLQTANDHQSFPGAKQCARRLVTFPVHGYVNQKDQERIIACLQNLSGDW